MGEAFITRRGGSGGSKYASGVLNKSSGAADYEIITGFKPKAIYLYNNSQYASCTFYDDDGTVTHAMTMQARWGGNGTFHGGYIEDVDNPSGSNYKGIYAYDDYSRYVSCALLEDGFTATCTLTNGKIFWCAVG